MVGGSNPFFTITVKVCRSLTVLSNLLTLLSSRLTLYFGHRTSFLNVSTDVAVSFRLGCNQPVHFRERSNPKSF